MKTSTRISEVQKFHFGRKTPMGRRQHAIGLDRLLLRNGGRNVEVFLTGVSCLTGHADQDAEELVEVTVELGVKSEIVTVFKVEAQHRGVLLASSSAPEFFSVQDLHFLQAAESPYLTL